MSNFQTLYINRPLLNGQDLYNWAEQQHFTNLLLPKYMHTTIINSRLPFDISNISKLNDTIIVYQPLDLKITKFNDALVLVFVHDELHSRWQEMCDCGASWDFQQYQPHITLSYSSTSSHINENMISAYTGKLVFGPEIWQILDEE